jgi:hypothetical protein
MVGELGPLGYHRGVLGYVRRVDQRAWEALLPDAEADPELKDVLLRNTYRLEEISHPELHEAAKQSCGALGLDVEVEFFQARGRAHRMRRCCIRRRRR